MQHARSFYKANMHRRGADFSIVGRCLWRNSFIFSLKSDCMDATTELIFGIFKNPADSGPWQKYKEFTSLVPDISISLKAELKDALEFLETEFGWFFKE